MFGKDRFNFESPNAIDAGELPPSAPTRSGRSSAPVENRRVNEEVSAPSTPRGPERHIINTSMDYVDARDSATQFLKDIEVSPTRGPVSYALETFHDEDEPLMDGRQDQGDAKLSTAPAHSVCFGKRRAESPSTNSSTSLFSLSQPSLRGQTPSGWHRPSRRGQRGRKLNVPSRNGAGLFHDDRSESESRMSKLLALFLCLAPVALIVLVIVPLAHLLKQDKNQEIYTNEKFISDRMLQTMDLLVDTGVSDRVAVSVQGTPQNLAAKWMADVDPLQYEIPSPGVEMEDSYHFVQRYVLVLLYHATGGNQTWHNNLDFLSQHHECSWYHSKEFTDGDVYAMGASCRGDDLQVTDLLLPANNLQGSIPTELTQLSHLQLLSFSHNKLSGTVPDLQKLSNLKYLDLGSNGFEGKIPTWINSLSNLVVFGLENNRLSGALPETLTALTNLVTLDLKNNLLKGNIDAINGLSKLEYLYLGHNTFNEFVDENNFLVNLPAIRELDISNNLFYGDHFPITLLQKPNLQVLDLSANALRGSIPATIEKNAMLSVLEINSNGFTGEIPTAIENLVNLKHLDMQMNHFVGTIPDHFVNLRELTYLSLGENDFTPGPIPAFLSSFTKLKELSLARCNRVGDIPSWFDIMSDLKFLNLQSNRLEGSVPQQVWDLPNLSVLLLSGNNLTGTIPEQVANVEEFQILGIGENNFVGEAGSFCTAAPMLDAFSFDCAKLSCNSTCCNTCCNVSDQDSSSCFSKQLLTALGKDQETWEFKYHSSPYSFSPNLIGDGGTDLKEKSVPGGAVP